jgi:hypothetical protein
LKTLTPNFERYEVRIDRGGWEVSGDGFIWEMHPGRNRLEVRTVNQFGVRGSVSSAEIELKE